MTSFPQRRGRLLLLAAALLFSTGGAAIKLSALSAWQIAGFRSGVAAIVLWIAMPGARRNWSVSTLLVGFAYALTLILFVLANRLTTSANAIFLQSTDSLYLLLLGPLVLHEAIHKSDLAVMAAIAGGAFLMIRGTPAALATAPDPAKGNLIALAAGVTWALTLTGLRRLARNAKNTDAAAATVISGNLMAFCLCLPAALPVAHVSLPDAAVILYLGIFQVALAYLALAHGIRYVPGLEASVLLLVEPVFNPIWTWLIHGERPGGLGLLGGVIVVVTAFVLALRRPARLLNFRF